MRCLFKTTSYWLESPHGLVWAEYNDFPSPGLDGEPQIVITLDKAIKNQYDYEIEFLVIRANELEKFIQRLPETIADRLIV